MYSNQDYKTLALYAWGHALVDAACAALVLFIIFQTIITPETAFIYAVLYNVLAFGLQPLFGAYADLKNLPKQTAFAGLLITALGLFFITMPIFGIILVGIGNAMYHVGGGIVTLRLGRGYATFPGVYVAPGAIGLFLGGYLGATGIADYSLIAGLLLLTGVLISKSNTPSPTLTTKSKRRRDYIGIALLLLLLVIGSRALVGFSISFPWRTGFILPLILVSGIALGKAMGGVLGDRFGWRKVAIGALVVSAPLLSFGSSVSYLGIIGAFLFNFSMPITLTAMARMLAGWEGFAFGLTTLSLVAGSLLAFAGFTNLIGDGSVILFSFILLSAVVLYYGLGLAKCEE